MRILITNIVLRSRTGTEVVTIELATAMARRGHEVAVFSPDVGESGRTLMASGIRVLTGVPDPRHHPWTPQCSADSSGTRLSQRARNLRLS